MPESEISPNSSDVPRCGQVQLEEPHAPPPIPERHELFAQDLDAQGQIAQVVGEADGLPEAAEVFAAGGPGPHVGELGILSRDLAVIVGAKPMSQEAVAAAPGALAAAPEAAGVRVWQITSREWSPRAGRSPPEGC